MIATVVVVLLFVVLGLGTLFVAMSGGARGVPDTLHTQSRGGRRAVMVAVTVVIVGLGLAIPIWVGASNGDNHAKRAPGGLTLTASQVHGRELFARNCATCHTLRAANAVGVVGPNLDNLHPPAALVLDAIQFGRARGNGQMPAGLLVGQDSKDVANFVQAVAGRG
jgi:mono/diheme cytochrome c family protein